MKQKHLIKVQLKELFEVLGKFDIPGKDIRITQNSVIALGLLTPQAS